MTPKKAPAGFTLIEIMVAMTILVIALGGFAALTFQYIRRVETASGSAGRTAVVNQQLNRFSAITFDSLAARAGCTTFSSADLPHTRCVTVVNVGNARHKRVTIIITPTNTRIKPDTILIDRTKPATSNPFNL
jgi:prepilin-type N-terminal cleavage/methylation domain-containing protein